MRISLWLLLCLACTGCGTPPVTTATPVPPAIVEATIIPEDGMVGRDIGAEVVGVSISVPAYYELQLATVVFRDGTFSIADSSITGLVNNQDQRQSCRLVSFSAHGPLRPDATDTLVLVNGRQIRFPTDESPMWGHNGPLKLTPGWPFMCIGQIIYGAKGAKTVDSDVHHPEGVAYAVHVFARLVPLPQDDPHYRELHAANHGSGVGQSHVIESLEQIIGPDPTPSPNKAAGF